MADSPLSRRIADALVQRVEAEERALRDWEDSIKPTTISSTGIVQELGMDPRTAQQQLSNTTAGAGVPISGVGVPGGLVGDWVPRITRVEPKVKQVKQGIPPGNWAVLFDRTWNASTADEATLFAKALLRFVGADVAGVCQISVPTSSNPSIYTRTALFNAASELGIAVEDGGIIAVGTKTKDYPVIATDFPFTDWEVVRDRTARWGYVLLVEGTTSGGVDVFFKVNQVATPEAIAGAGSVTLTQYDDIDLADVSLSLIENPNSPFSPSSVGASSFEVNRPRYTTNSAPVLLTKEQYTRFDNGFLEPYSLSVQRNRVNPQILALAGTGINTGFFSQVNTRFPGGGNYRRLE